MSTDEITSLLDKLKAGSSNTKLITWPGTETKIQIRVLTDQDYVEAGMAADRLYKSAGLSIGVENIADYEAEKSTQLLFRAVCDPVTGSNVTNDIQVFRRLMTKPIRDRLVSELNQFQDECSPDPYSIDENEFSALMLRIKKNAETSISSVSNIFLARKLITTLVAELASLQAANGSS